MASMVLTWTVEGVVLEIQNISKIMRARNNSDVASALVKNIIYKISKLGNLDSCNCLKLYEAIEGSSIMPELKAEVCKAIDAKLLDAGLEESATGGYGQKIDDAQNWLTQGDWDKIGDPNAGYHSILIVVSERLASLRVSSLKESSKKAWTAMMVNVAINKAGKMPSYEQIYQLSIDLQQYVKSCPKKSDPQMPFLKSFPRSPDDLTAGVLEIAYPEEKPVTKNMDKMAALIAHHTPVRDTSILLKKIRKKHLDRISSSESWQGQLQRMLMVAMCHRLLGFQVLQHCKTSRRL